MAAIIAPHLIPLHGLPQEFWPQLQRMQPPVIKTLELNHDHVRRLHEASPHSIICLRDHPLSEQWAAYRRDPAGLGREHAEDWARKIEATSKGAGVPAELLMGLGLNEPPLDWRIPGAIDRVNAYSVTLARRARELGILMGIVSGSVGWPDQPPGTHGTQTPPNWADFEPIGQAILEYRQVLVWHEYWDLPGPAHGWGWWAGRVLTCPWQVPIMILECGIDRHVADPSLVNAYDKRGWKWYGPSRGGPDDVGYANQIIDYAARMAADPRVICVAPFTYDGGSDWTMFYIQGQCWETLVDYMATAPRQPRPWVYGPTPQPKPEPQPQPPAWPLVGLPQPYAKWWHSQLGPQAAFAPGDCGPAALAAVLTYAGQRVTVDELSRATGRPPQFTESSATDLMNVAGKYGQPTRWDRGLGLQDLRAELAAGRPVICLVFYQALPVRYNQEYDQCHWVTVVGLEGNPEQPRGCRVHYLDPWYPVNSPGVRWARGDLFLAAWGQNHKRGNSDYQAIRFPQLKPGGQTPSTWPPDSMLQAVLARAARQGRLHFNERAALQRRIARDGFWWASDEFTANDTSQAPVSQAVAQLAVHPATGEWRVYMCPMGRYSDSDIVHRPFTP